jgi:hypothetical protein
VSDLIGRGTVIDDILADYFPEESRAGVLGQLVEDEQTLLLAALLVEQRGEPVDQDTTGSREAEYLSRELTATAEEDSTSWDWTASTVVLYGFDEPIDIAFKSPGQPDRIIPVTPSEAPFSLAPPGGLDTSEVWYSLGDGASSDTQFTLLAL